MMQQTQSLRKPQPRLKWSLYKSSQARQKSIRNFLLGDKIKEEMTKLASKFFIYENLLTNKAVSHHFKNLVIGCQWVGISVELLTPYKIKTKCLDLEYDEMKKICE